MNNKLFNIILYVLLGLSAILGIYFYLATDFSDAHTNTGTTSGILIGWCYLLLGIATIVTIAFPIYFMSKNPTKAKSALIGIGALLVVFGIGYLTAGDEVVKDIDGIVLADAGTSQLSEAGIIAFYIMGIVAIGSIIYAEVSKMFK